MTKHTYHARAGQQPKPSLNRPDRARVLEPPRAAGTDVRFDKLAVALLAPIAAFVSERFIEAARRRRAYQRIVREPLIHVGAVLERLEISGRETPLVGRCRITSLASGPGTAANSGRYSAR